MSIKLDLSKFKHIASDDKTTTLQHEQGHKLTLAHKGLSEDNKKQLEALSKSQPKSKDKSDKKPVKMSEGGYVDQFGKWIDSVADKASGASRQPASEKINRDLDPKKVKDMGFEDAFAEGGKVQRYATGGQAPMSDMGDNPIPEDLATEYPSIKAPTAVEQALDFTPDPNFKGPTQEDRKAVLENDPSIGANSELHEKYGMPYTPADKEKDVLKQMGMEKASKDSESAWRASEPTTEQKQANEMNKLRADAGLPPLAVPGAPAIGPVPGLPDQAGLPPGAAGGQPPQAPMQGAMDDTEKMMRSGYDKQLRGINAESKALQDLSANQIPILKKQQEDQSIAKFEYDNQYKTLDKERQAFIQDIKDGHIDPEKYWTGDKDGNGSHSKIMSGIGMIIAGFQPMGAPNAAINFLEKQMEMNLKAQEKNLDSKNNLLKANYEQFKNLKDATDMTRAMQKDMVASQLEQAAATAKSPLAKAAALQAAGKLQLEAAPMMQQFAMRRAMMNLANQPGGQGEGAIDQMIGYLRLTNPPMAKEMETRRVPGMGMATVAVPENVRSNLIAHQDVDRALQQTIDFTKNHSGSLDPRTRAQGATLMNELMSKVRTAEQQGVYKKSEAEFMTNTIGDNPAHFFSNITTLPKLQQMQQLKHAEYQQLGKGYGLNVPNLQSAPQMKTVNGVQYMRGPNGEAIKVK